MKLTIDSICLISSIIDQIKVDDEFIQEMLEIGNTAKGQDKETVEKIQKQIGLKIALKIGSKLYLVKDELIKFVANYKDISEEEAAKANIIEIIKELLADKDFTSFFKEKVMSE